MSSFAKIGCCCFSNPITTTATLYTKVRFNHRYVLIRKLVLKKFSSPHFAFHFKYGIISNNQTITTMGKLPVLGKITVLGM